MRRKIPNVPPPDRNVRSSLEAPFHRPLPAPMLRHQTQGSESDSHSSVARSSFVASFALPLECITPVVGGGVEHRTPDEVEGVRISGIRGQLRMWWRALQNITDSKKLFEAESDVWGGVSVTSTGADDAKGQDDTARPDRTTNQEKTKTGSGMLSRVSLRVAVREKGTDLPAGRYEGKGGTYRALPEWDGGPAMGYGLFPLQLDSDEKRRETLASLPTHSVRHGLKFELHITIVLPPNRAEAENMLRGVLASLWAWIHFGGVGARTTRGFGALSVIQDGWDKRFDVLPLVSSLSTFDKSTGTSLGSETQDATRELETMLRDYLKQFAEIPQVGNILEWLNKSQKDFGRLKKVPDKSESTCVHPRLPAKSVAYGSTRRTAKEALYDGLDQLKTFRQGPGVGRRAGSPRPGRSFWPEADTLRRVAIEKRNARFTTHKPANSNSSHDGAPRAAFGMPLNTPFKDQEDKVADGAFVPAYGGRWTSPLRIRPLRTKDGFVSLMIYLDQPFPNAKVIQNVAAVLTRQQAFDEVETEVPILSWTGAHSPIQELLKRHNGNAVLAFYSWLENRGFTVIKERP